MVAFLLAAALPPASASIILYEGFDYSTGSLHGRNGGIGFSGAWDASSGFVTVASPGLSQGDLTTSGNMLLSTQSVAISRAFDATGLTGNGATYWFSVLMSAPDVLTGTASALPAFFSNLTSPYAQAQGFSFAFNPTSSTAAYIDIRIGGSVRASTNVTSPNYYGETHLFLGRITFSDAAGQDKFELWMNPVLNGTEDALGSPLLSAFGQWNDTGANNAFRYNKYDEPDRAFDEIRLATTYAEALPSSIPEPSTVAAIAGLASLALVASARRLRRQRADQGIQPPQANA